MPRSISSRDRVTEYRTGRDLSDDIRALAFQRRESRYEFGNSRVHLRHREDWLDWPNFTYDSMALEPQEKRFLLRSGELICRTATSATRATGFVTVQ
jgi:hypothetical protein